MVRVGHVAPRKVADADAANPILSSGKLNQSQKSLPAISAAELACVLKRLGELEEKLVVLSKNPNDKPADAPSEKDDILKAAAGRVDTLETELAATKKVTTKKKTNIIFLK